MKRHILLHKLSAFMLSLMMLLSNIAPTVAYAMEDKQDDFYEYELTKEGYKILKLTNKGREKLKDDDYELVIPEKHEGVPVVGIGKEAFKDEKIKKLTLPISLKKIEEKAFAKVGLEKVEIYPEDKTLVLDEVGDEAFEENNLEEMPFIVKEIGSRTYKDNKLKEVDLSYTEKIGEEAFVNNKELKPIVNKYTNLAEKVFDDETAISYTKTDFLKKQEDTNIDYLKERENLLNSSRETKTEEKKEEKQTQEDDEDGPEQPDTNVIEKEKNVDEVIKDSQEKLEKPKKINKKEYNLLRKKHQTPKRLSFHLLNRVYAADNNDESQEEKDDVRIGQITSKWIVGEEEGNRHYTEDKLRTLVWHKEEEGYVRLKTDFALSGQKDHDVGSIQVRVPKYIFKNRDGKYTGLTTLGISPMPSKKGAFAYLDTGDEYLIINTKPLSAATSVSFEMTYRNLNPHEIQDMVKGYKTDDFQAKVEVLTKTGEVVKAEGNKLKAQVDTREYIENPTKQAQKIYDGEYPDSWPSEIKPENPEDYIFIAWKTNAVNQGSQPFKVDLEDTAKTSDHTNGAKILGIRRNSDMKMFATNQKSTDSIKNMYPENGKEYDFTMPGVNFHATVYVAYPKSNFFDENGKPLKEKYTIDNKVKYTLTSQDDQEKTSVEAVGQVEYTPKEFPVPEASAHIFKSGYGEKVKDNIGIYEERLNDLNRGVDVDVSFRISSTIIGEKFTKPDDVKPFGIKAFGRKDYTSIMKDDKVLFDGMELDKNDYQFNSITVDGIETFAYDRKYDDWTGYRPIKNQLIGDQNIKPDEWAFTKTSSVRKPMKAIVKDQDGNELAEITYDGNISVKALGKGEVNRNKIIFPENTTSYTIETTSRESAYKLHIIPEVKIKASKKIVERSKSKFNGQSKANAYVDNTASVTVKEDKTLKDESTGRDRLSGEYYSEAYPQGHFMMFKWGDGEEITLPNDKKENLAQYLNATTNSGKRMYRGIYPKHLNQIKKGNETEVYYQLETDAFGMPWTYDEKKNAEVKKNDPSRKEDFVDEAFNQKSYTVTSRDDEVFFEKDRKFTSQDFEFTKIRLKDATIWDYKKFEKDGVGYRESNQTRFNGVVRYGTIAKGDYGYVENKDVKKRPTFAIYGKSDNSDYVKYGEIKFTGKNTYSIKTENGATSDETFLIFPKNTTAYKIVATTKLDGLRWAQEPHVKLKQSDYIKTYVNSLFEKDSMPSTILNNKSHLDLKLYDEDSNNVVEPIGEDELRGITPKETDLKNHFSIQKEGFGDVVEKVDPNREKSKYYGKYSMYLNRIANGDKNAEISYKVKNKGFGLPFTYDGEDPTDINSFKKVPYTMISRDFFMDLKGTELNKDDFEFTGVKFEQPQIYDYVQFTENGYGYYEKSMNGDWKYFQHLGGNLVNTSDSSHDYIEKGQYGYKEIQDFSKLDDFDILGASDDENYQKYGTVSFKTGKPVVSPENGAKKGKTEDEIRFPENITKYKVVAKTNLSGIQWRHEPKVRIKNSEKVKAIIDKIYKESANPETNAENKVDLNVKTGKDEKINFINEDTGFDKLDGMVYGTSTFKDLKYTNDTTKEVIHLDYYLTTKIQTNIQTKEDLDYAIANGGYVEETKSVFYDLLPKEVKADLSSIETAEGDVISHAEVKENYRNSGRDLLVVELKRKPKYTMQEQSDSIINQKGLMDMPYIRFKANYSWKSATDLGKRLGNHSVYRSANPNFGNMLGFKGENNDPDGGNNKTTKQAFINMDGKEDSETKEILKNLNVDTPNVKGKGNSYLYAYSGNNLIVDVSSSASLRKAVDATGTGVFATGTEEDVAQNVYERQKYQYRVSLEANNSSDVKDIILFDKLEGYSPTPDKVDYKDEVWRGTFLGVDTRQLEDKGIKPVLYYTTRKDIEVDNLRDKSMNDISDTSIWKKWSERPKAFNSRNVTAIALDVRKNKDGSDFVLREGQSFSYLINMVAPNLSEDKNEKGLPYTKDDQEEKNQWYDKFRDVVDRDLKKVKVQTGIKDGKPVYEELVFENAIYENEEGLTGGAHAYNNIISTLTTVQKGKESRNQLIRHDYTKVGLKPHKLKIEKQWDDDNDRDGKRPEVINVTIKANGKEWKKVQLKKENDWKLELLAPYGDNEGKKITYTFEEEVPKEYKFQVREDKPSEDGRDVKLENSYEPEKVEIGINKTWTDREEQDEADRPKEIELTLIDKETKEELSKATVKADKDGKWNYTFKNLPKYKNHGQLITYDVIESNVLDYVTTVQDEEDFKDNKKTVKINNRFYPYGDLVVSKKIENGTQLAIDDNEFKFTLNISKNKDDKSDRFVGDYKAQKYDDKGNKVGKEITVTDGSDFTLKHNEKMVIKDIDSRFEYKVVETETKAFTTSNTTNEGFISASKAKEADYVNRYETEGSLQLKLKKLLDGRKLRGYDFKFNIYDVTDKNNRKLVNKTPITNKADGSINYLLKYNSTDLGTNDNGLVNQTVTKKYEVEEVDEGKNDKDKYGFFYDDKKIFVTVDLEDDGHGNIKTSAKYNKEGLFNDDDTAFTFNNKYRADREYKLEAFKHVLDGIKIKENQFEFTLTQVGVYENKNFKNVDERKKYSETETEKVNFSTKNNGKIVSRAFSDTNGKAVFDKYDGKPFVFNQYDIGKTFVFDIEEVDNSKNDGNVIFDKAKVRRYVSIYDGGLDEETKKGTLQIDESTEYIIDEGSLEKAKESAKAIIKKYRREDAEAINKKIDGAGSVEDVKKVLNETEGLFPLFSNKYKPGKIKVSKKVENGDPQNPGKEFKFRIKLKGEDSKVPDGSLEMKREAKGYLPATGWKLPEGSKNTEDGFEFDVQQQDGKDKVEVGEDDMGHYVSWDYGLTEDSPYNESRIVKFYGELSPDKMKVTSINQDGKEKTLDSNKNINQELQNLTSAGTNFNDKTNWLVFNDNGTEKLVAKKPLKSYIAWNSLYNAGLVFGEDGVKDLINADFTDSNYEYNSKPLQHLKDYGKGKGTPKNYKPTYVTVNNKKYIVRLMRAYNEKVGINDNHDWSQYSTSHYNATKGSEWNRLILPLIADGRYGSNTKDFIESNMPTLANYSWWTDFGGSDSNGYYRWMQEAGYDGSKWRADRGYDSSSDGAAGADSVVPYGGGNGLGWLAVLEEAKEDSVANSNTNKNIRVATSGNSLFKSNFLQPLFKSQGSEESQIEIADNSTEERTFSTDGTNVKSEKMFKRKAQGSKNSESVTRSESTLSDGTTPVWELNEEETTDEELVVTFRNEKPVLNIVFDANGGQGSMKDLEYEHNLPEGPEVKFYKPNYRFTGWKFYNQDGTEIQETDFPEQGKITAKAQWEKRNPNVNFQNGVGYFTLLAGENGVFDNLPANMDYEIEELTDEEWYNENPAYKDLSNEEKQKLISSDAGWTLKEAKNNKGKVPSNETVETQFTNDFQAGKTKVNIEGLKTLNGRTVDVKDYEFTLFQSDANWEEAKKLTTAKSDENGRFKFNDINYTVEDLEGKQEKTYYYMVLENQGILGKANIDYDSKFHKIKVVVSRKDQDGKVLLQARVEYLDEGNQLVIKNKTEKTNLTITKTFLDDYTKETAKDKSFTVQVRLSSNKIETLTLNKDNNFTATIENLEIGTTYEVIETNIPEGFKEVSPENQTGTTIKGENKVNVVNKYVPYGNVEFTLNKNLIGRPLQDKEFDFKLYDEKGKQIGDTFTNTTLDENDTEPNKIKFNVPVEKKGTYTFLAKEVDTKDKTVLYDTKPIKVEVEVIDDGKGNLTTGTVKYGNNRDTFTNTLKPGSLQITKTVNNLLNTDKDFTVKVKLYDKDDTELTKSYKYTSNKNKNEQTIKSGDSITIKANETITIQDLPVGARYEVEETNVPEKFTRVSKEKEGGTIELDKPAKVEIINQYDSSGEFYLKAKKELTDKDGKAKELKGDDFSFALMEIKPKGQGYKPEEIKYFTNDKDGNVEIGPIAVSRDELVSGIDENGKQILNLTKKYRLIEAKSVFDKQGNKIKEEDPKIKYDTSSYEITVEFEEQDGQIKVKNQTVSKQGKEVENPVFKNETKPDDLTSIKIGKEVLKERPDLKENPKFGIRIKLTYPDKTETVLIANLSNNEEYLIDSLPIGTQYEIEEFSLGDDYKNLGYASSKVDVQKDKPTSSVFTNTKDKEVTEGNAKGITELGKQEQVKIVNERKPQRVELHAEKLLDGKATDREFKFALKEDGKDEPIQVVTNKRKLIDFEEILYENFTDPKVYYIEEINEHEQDIVYDKTKFKAVVSKNTDGELEVKYSIVGKDNKEVEVPVFKNESNSLPKTGKNVLLALVVITLTAILSKMYLTKKETE